MASQTEVILFIQLFAAGSDRLCIHTPRTTMHVESSLLILLHIHQWKPFSQHIYSALGLLQVHECMTEYLALPQVHDWTLSLTASA